MNTQALDKAYAEIFTRMPPLPLVESITLSELQAYVIENEGIHSIMVTDFPKGSRIKTVVLCVS